MAESICTGCGGKYDRKPGQVRRNHHRCPACNRRRQKLWRDGKKAAGNPVKSNKMPREYHRKYEEEYWSDPKSRAARAARERRYRKIPALKLKQSARWITNRAISVGILVRKPCEKCGAKKVDAHHDNYMKPLDVRWLCRKHHVEFHKCERAKNV